MKILLGVAVAALVVSSTAAAAVPSWWWTPRKANLMVMWANPQGLGRRGDVTTMLKASCAGDGAVRKNAKGVRLFHVFRCYVWFRDDDTGSIWTPEYMRAIGMNDPRIHICSSKTVPDHILPYGLGVPGCP